MVCFTAPAFAQAEQPPPPPEAVAGGSPAALPPPPPLLLPPPPEPLAGYTNGSFFLRSAGNNFVLFPTGRLQIDGYFFANRGPEPTGTLADSQADPRPRQTIFLRRVRPEVAGTFFKHFDFWLAGEFATVPAGLQYGSATDVLININYTPWANVQVGQFDAPFTLENRTSDKFFDFMERSIAVRGLGVPSNKEAGVMVWGLAPRKYVFYSVGVFDGDGQNLRNLDSQFDVVGRAYFAPLALLPQADKTRWLQEIWIGASGWYGQRVAVPFDLPALTTQGGVSLLPSVLSDGSHLVPNGQVGKWAAELNAPIGPFGLRFEIVGVQDGLSLFDKAFPTDKKGKSYGNLNRNGLAFYLEAWYWILGDYKILPTPGLELPPRYKGYEAAGSPWKFGLFVAAKYERVSVSITDTGEAQNAFTGVQKDIQGNMTVDVAEIGLNAWLTKHLRFTANYVLNYLDGDIKILQQGGRYYRTAEHEFLFRAGASL